jgi:Tol biopolymer transport system component
MKQHDWAIMKSFLIMSVVPLIMCAQSIDETLQKIYALKSEIAQNSKMVEQKIADLKRINPLFADQGPFESDAEYLGRMSRAMPQIDALRKQYLGDLWSKMAVLRGRLFETNNIQIVIDPKQYDANKEEWPVKVVHADYQREILDIVLHIKRDQAGMLWKNWDKVKRTGILAIDVGDKVGLAKLLLCEPIGGVNVEHECQPMKSFQHIGEVSSVAFSPDGRLLATGCDDKISRLFNLETGKEAKALIQNDEVRSVAFSPDGKFLTTGSGDILGGKARVYNLETGHEVKSFKHERSVNSVAFSPDGKYLATGSGTIISGVARIFNLETSHEVKSFKHEFPVNSVAFSSDGKYLATGCDYQTAQLFELETGQEVKSFQHGGAVKSVAFSPDGKYLATGCADKTARLFNLETGQEVKSFQHGGAVRSVAFSPDGKYLATGCADKTARLFNVKTDQDVKSLLHNDDVRSVAFSPDGKYIATASGSNAKLFRTLLQAEDEVLTKKAISLPPSLAAKVAFIEPSGNKILDALEKGRFVVDLVNSGKGPAKGVLIKISPELTENLDYNNSYIDEIPAGGTKSVEILIEAYVGVKDGQHTFRFSFEEVNGFPPPPVEIQLSTQEYLKPEMFVVGVDVSDDNGNGKIESGEMVKLTIRIGNRGKGVAKSAYAKFYPGDNTFITDAYPKVVKIGDLPFNKTFDVPLQFFVNDRTKEEIPLYVDLTEETNLATVSKLRIPVNKSEQARSISRTVVEGQKDQFGQLTIEGGLKIDVEQNIPVTANKNPNAVAVVIGIRDYASNDIPRVEYAKRDAQMMREYLVKAFGYDPKNILPQNPEELMTVGSMKSLLRTKLPSYLKPDGSSDVFVYYAGHGAPSTTSQQPFFVPYDCDPSFVSDENAYRMSDFYSDIAKTNAKRKIVVIDACFSGQSGDGRTVVRNASSVLLKVDNPLLSGKDAIVFQSSESNQVSNWYPEKKHGMFTYFFLKGLRGDADLNKDGKITVGELETYINDENNNLPYLSRREFQRPQKSVVRGERGGIVVSK